MVFAICTLCPKEREPPTQLMAVISSNLNPFLTFRNRCEDCWIFSKLMVDWIDVGAVCQPHTWSHESGCCLLEKSHSIVCRICNRTMPCQGSAATRSGWCTYIRNLTSFPAVKELWKSMKINEVTAGDEMVVRFCGHRVEPVYKEIAWFWSVVAATRFRQCKISASRRGASIDTVWRKSITTSRRWRRRSL